MANWVREAGGPRMHAIAWHSNVTSTAESAEVAQISTEAPLGGAQTHELDTTFHKVSCACETHWRSDRRYCKSETLRSCTYFSSHFCRPYVSATTQPYLQLHMQEEVLSPAESTCVVMSALSKHAGRNMRMALAVGNCSPLGLVGPSWSCGLQVKIAA